MSRRRLNRSYRGERLVNELLQGALEITDADIGFDVIAVETVVQEFQQHVPVKTEIVQDPLKRANQLE